MSILYLLLKSAVHAVLAEITKFILYNMKDWYIKLRLWLNDMLHTKEVHEEEFKMQY